MSNNMAYYRAFCAVGVILGVILGKSPDYAVHFDPLMQFDSLVVRGQADTCSVSVRSPAVRMGGGGDPGGRCEGGYNYNVFAEQS